MAQAKLLALALLATAVTGKDNGPTKPINSYGVSDCFGPQNTRFFSDDKNLCWYHECVPNYGLQARRCPLGTFIPENYLFGKDTPCMGRFAIMGLYDCTRKSNATFVPACYTNQFSTSGCQNGGTPRWLGELCWCDCPLDFQGSPDCSVRRGTTPATVYDGICPDGTTPQNFCASGPCKNAGICRNQCTGPVCQCRAPFTASKFCDAFTCDNNPCRNNGTCHRGDNQNPVDTGNRQEFYSCTCLPGFTGFDCEIKL